MSAYSKTKLISKFLMYFSLLTVLVAGGSFFVSRSKIGADTNAPKTYEVMTEGSTVTGVIAKDIRASEVINYDYTANPNSDIERVTGDCRLGSNCYLVWNTNVWHDPSIQVDNGQQKPAWAFLQEVKGRASSAGDTTAVNQINNICANYVIGAFSKSLKPYFDFTSTSGAILISYRQFFDALSNVGIAEKDPYVDFYEEKGQKMAKVKFAPTYPGATNNSAWLAGVNFVANSMIKPYKDAGYDATEYEAAINAAKQNYAFGITKEDKAKALSVKYPANVLISNQTDRSFEYNIDVKSFPSPAKGYKTKIFIKPVSKKDDNVYISFGPFAESSYQFSWGEATSSGYVDSNGQKASVSGSDYDLTFPQQYVFRVVTYDSDSEKDNVLATIQTQTEATASAATEVSDGNSVLKISAKPAAVKQGEKVTAKIEAINSSDPANQISKVVLYACTGTSGEVATNDSTSCTFKNKDGVAEDAVKAAFVLGSNLVFTNGKAALESSWNTSNSAIGNHALMAKAFGNNSSDPYIDNSKTAVTIQVTNTEVGDVGAGGASGTFGDLLAGQFNKKASDNPRGSSVRSIGDLVNKITNWIFAFAGIFAFFAIIVGGFQYMGAGGDQAKLGKAKKTIIFAIVGVALVSLSMLLVKLFISIVNSIIG